MSLHGALTLPRAILTNPDSSPSLVKSVIALMRNLCADDKRKDRLVSDGTLDLMIAAMNKDEYSKDSLLMEHAFACLAMMSLR